MKSALAVVVGCLFLGGYLASREDQTIVKSVSNWGQVNTLVVGLPHFSLPLDVARIGSVSQFIVLDQLSRTLVVRNRDLQLTGDLAESWTVSPDDTKYEFVIKENQRFSDGSLITAKQIQCSIHRQMKIDRAIHFDFSSIERVSVKKSRVTIILKAPNPRFVQQVALPEFSILSAEQCERDISQLDFAVTSGPYFLVHAEEGQVHLERNLYFEQASAPQFLKILGRSWTELTALLKEGALDFSLGAGELEVSELESLLKSQGFRAKQPHIGFTYWLSANEFHPDFQSRDNRRRVISLVNRHLRLDLDSNPFWSQARQLFLPDGSGRLSSVEVDAIWQQMEVSEKASSFSGPVHILLQKDFKFKIALRQAFEAAGLQTVWTFYSSLDDFERHVLDYPEKYHLVQINNDYSSVDLFENLKVTLNPDRPLIFEKSYTKKLQNLMTTASTSRFEDISFGVYRDIEKLLLEEGLVFPVVYNHLIFFVGDGLDISNWSELSPEVSFWKIKPQNSP